MDSPIVSIAGRHFNLVNCDLLRARIHQPDTYAEGLTWNANGESGRRPAVMRERSGGGMWRLHGGVEGYGERCRQRLLEFLFLRAKLKGDIGLSGLGQLACSQFGN